MCTVEDPHPNKNSSIGRKNIKWLLIVWINSRALTFHTYCSQTWYVSLCVFFFFFPRRAFHGRHVISALYRAAGIFFNRIGLLFTSPFFKCSETVQSSIRVGREGIWCQQKVCWMFLFHQQFHIILIIRLHNVSVTFNESPAGLL